MFRNHDGYQDSRRLKTRLIDVLKPYGLSLEQLNEKSS